MVLLVVGLLLFLGTHTLRVWGEPLRARLVERLGEGPFKGIYSLASIAGFALLVWGYGEARADPHVLWALPVGARHAGSLLTLIGFVCLAAAYVPGTHIRARLGHPMMVGVGLWAVAHLLANGTVADLLLFGGFLAWILVGYPAARARDRAAGVERAPIGWGRDLVAVAVGVGLWCAFAFGLHAWLFGVAPFG